ncbi:MAG: hypothetical protein M1836_002790 [Candelina mexicana]|nr:MAG: hypothetical protein M1836_002790 [Candelina mexicana]
MSVRKAHNSGRNHLRNVVDYYQRTSPSSPPQTRTRKPADASLEIGHEKAQSVIDSITSSYAAEGQSSSNPMLGQQPGPGGPFPPPFGFPGGPGGMPPPPFGNMPGGPPSASGLPPPPGGGRGMPFPPFPGPGQGPPPPMPGGMPFPPPGGLPPNFAFPPPGFPPPNGMSPGPMGGGPGGPGGPGGFPPPGFPGMGSER